MFNGLLLVFQVKNGRGFHDLMNLSCPADDPPADPFIAHFPGRKQIRIDKRVRKPLQPSSQPLARFFRMILDDDLYPPPYPPPHHPPPNRESHTLYKHDLGFEITGEPV